jgi:type I restriction enzyme, S subunit
MTLPSNWCETQIAEIASVQSGYGFPEALQGRPEGEIPFFKVGDISEAWKRGSEYLLKANHYVSQIEADRLRASLFPRDSVVFAKIGAAIALNRRALLGQPSLVDNNVMALLPETRGVDPKYLFHFMCTVRLGELSQATTVPSVRKSDVERVPVPLAPLAEQQRIVAEIEKQFTRLDDAVAALKRVQANLKRYRASVLKAACEGRLVPTEAELARKEKRSYEPASELLKRILAERRAKWEAHQLAKMISAGKPPNNDEWKKKYKEPIPPETSNLPALTEGWIWVTIDQLSERVTKGSSPGWQGFDYAPSGILFLRSQNVLWGKLDLTDSVYLDTSFNSSHPTSVVSTGDVLLNIVGASIGRCAVATPEACGANTNQAVASIRPTITGALSWFLMYQLISPGMQAFIRGTAADVARANFNLDDIRPTVVVLAPAEETDRIVTELQRQLSVVDAAQREVESQLTRAKRLRAAVLNKAFEGALILQDPADEPASVLLDRIRNERAQKPGTKTRRRGKRAIAEEVTV